MVMYRRAALALLLGAAPASAVNVQYKPEARLETEQALGDIATMAMKRFEKADTNNDGYVTYWELVHHYGMNNATLKSGGDSMVRLMLMECNGKTQGEYILWCNRKNMTNSLQLWQKSTDAKSELRMWQADHSTGFTDNDNLAGMTRASMECKHKAQYIGEEQTECKVEGTRCFAHGPFLAWALDEVCTQRACVCQATKSTKRLTKLGIAGALAVMTSANLQDDADPPMAPACGASWVSFPLTGTIENFNSQLSAEDKSAVEMHARVQYQDLQTVSNIRDGDVLKTEAVIYKSNRHRVVANGPLKKVCMISWAPSTDSADFKADFLKDPVSFAYGGKGDYKGAFKVPKGYAMAYESIRDKLKAKFEEECCNPEVGFEADKLVISGHSRGGALAELNAMDAVANWECQGRDLTGQDIALITAGPPHSMLPMTALNNVFSCNDGANCLAGSVVTLTTHLDPVSDQKTKSWQAQAPRHPSSMVTLPCPKFPEYKKFYNKFEKENSRDWCHHISNYLPQIEEVLVNGYSWGSSCAGECGELNRQIQCSQYAQITGKPCSAIENPKPIPGCNSSGWRAKSEMCDCWWAECPDFTEYGCKL